MAIGSTVMVPHRPVPRLASWWVIGALCLVIAPQLLRVPAWTGVLISLCLLWRVTIDLGRVGFPNKIMKTLIVVAAVSLTITHYRDLGGGLDAAVSLLLIGAVFKLLEMRQARDMLIVVSLCYLLILVAFIYSQSILSAVHALLSFVVTTAALIS